MGNPDDAESAPIQGRPLRVIVTGSRLLKDRLRIKKVLKKLPPGSTVVHGGCSTGADFIADSIARELGLNVEVHKANWKRGPRAGPERNLLMAQLGADFCLAFPVDPTESPCIGTRDMVRKADAHGIDVWPPAYLASLVEAFKRRTPS